MPDAAAVAAPARSETVMAFDFGEKRIGIAIGETLFGQARALATVAESANDRRFAAIGKFITEWQPARLIVGLPHHVDDRAHEFAARCTRFAHQLAGRYRLPVEFVDERYSSCAAEAKLTGNKGGDGDKRKPTVKARLDAAAAAIILQAWLDQRNSPDRQDDPHHHDAQPTRCH